MQTRSLVAIAIAASALMAAAADAQVRKITTIPQAPRQAAPPGTAAFGMPSPSGLASPNPAQLTPPGPPSLTPPGVPNLASPGAPPGSPVVDPGVQVTYAGGGGANVMGAAGLPRGPISAVDIARAFLDADINRDGELSRNEAQRVGFLAVPFDDLDRNHDGALSRFEYEDAFR